MSLAGKSAIITGGGRGIGYAIALELAQRGAQVVLAGRSAGQLEQAAAEIQAATGKKTLAIPTDVAEMESVQALVKHTLDEFSRVDILVNNAGITRDNLIMRMTETDWDEVLRINLTGAWNCCKAVIRPMMRQRNGRIINITSVSGLAGQVGQTNYSASKAGMIGLTKSLAREVASRGITVNAVAPGFVPTDLTVELPENFKEASLHLIPVGRWGTPEEVAHAAAFFAADECGYITGQVLSVDGGMTMM